MLVRVLERRNEGVSEYAPRNLHAQIGLFVPKTGSDAAGHTLPKPADG
jgi:hypothetical protein